MTCEELQLFASPIDLLALTNTYHAPLRENWREHREINYQIGEIRNTFRKFGLPIAKSGGASVDRKAAERNLDKLEQTGLIAFSRHAGRRAYWKLTDRGDWQIRSLVGDYLPNAMLSALYCLAYWQQRPHEEGTNQVPETFLAGCDWDATDANKRLRDLQNRLSPALVRDWVKSNADADGAVAYTLTELCPPLGDLYNNLPVSGDLLPFSEQAAEMYEDSIEAAEAEIQRATPDRHRDLIIPLGCGSWPEFKNGPAVYDADGNPRTCDEMLAILPKDVLESKQ